MSAEVRLDSVTAGDCFTWMGMFFEATDGRRGSGDAEQCEYLYLGVDGRYRGDPACRRDARIGLLSSRAMVAPVAAVVALNIAVLAREARVLRRLLIASSSFTSAGLDDVMAQLTEPSS